MSFLAIFFIAALLLLAAWGVLSTRPRQTVQTQLPAMLEKARTWAKEREFRIGGRRPMHGVLDEAFELPDGTIVISETKSRRFKTIYKSDVLQVSAQRVLVENHQRRTVSSEGFVRLLTPQGNEFRPIKLMTADEVAQAYDLYRQLSRGAIVGDKCRAPNLCRSCAYKEECDDMDR